MGSLQADEFAAAVEIGEIDLRSALEWHLRHNHYPPRSNDSVDIAVVVVNGVNTGQLSLDTRLANLVNEEGEHPLVWDVIAGWHLESFIHDDEVFLDA